MRIAPVAVRFAADPARLRDEAARSAQVTHAHPVGVDAAVVQAVAIGAALRRRRRRPGVRRRPEPKRWQPVYETSVSCSPRVEDRMRRHARVGSSSDARGSVCAAIYTALAHEALTPALRYAVRLGGDTDTVAAMTGAIAGARHGASSIPRQLARRLEEGDRGRSHVEQLRRPPARVTAMLGSRAAAPATGHA